MDIEIKESLNIMKNYYINKEYKKLLKKNHQIIGMCDAFKKMATSQKEKDLIDLILLNVNFTNFILEDVDEVKKTKEIKMKKYTSTKIYQAEPLSYKQANKQGLIKHYNSDIDDKPGYLLLIEDSFDGYLNKKWLPKEIFENGYIEVEEN